VQKIIATADTFLKKKVVQSVELAENEKVAVKKGQSYGVTSHVTTRSNHVQVELAGGAGLWYAWGGHWQFPWEDIAENKEEQTFLSTVSLKAIAPDAALSDIVNLIDPLNKCLNRFNLLTGKRAAAFLAMVACETSDFSRRTHPFEEKGSTGEQDIYLGNYYESDAQRYRPRGFLPLVGRANYRQCGLDLGYDLEKNPDWVAERIDIGLGAAGWLWTTRNLNRHSDTDNFAAIVAALSPQLSRSSVRFEYWKRARKAFGVEEAFVEAVAGKIDWGNNFVKISKFFTVREVTLGDKRRIPKNPNHEVNIIETAKALDRVRELRGLPILTSSWYRPTEINREVGGVGDSQHLTGNAVDVYPADINDLFNFQRWLDLYAWNDKALGYGAVKGFVHLDRRKGRIRWNY
jgi:putative chitinase